MRFALMTLILLFLVGCSHTANRPVASTGLEAKNALSEVPRTTRYKAQVDRAVQQLLTEKWVAGVVVGLIAKDSVELYGYGHVAKAGSKNKAPTQDTIFEIGSVTKTFTAILLAEMVRLKKVRLDQPVQSLLPSGVTLASLDGKPITLAHLAAHVSGLPRMPSNFRPRDGKNPYIDYSKERLYHFIKTWKPVRAPGARYAYSNLGFGLLGHVLALKAGKPYEELLKTWILKPLDLRHTSITLNANGNLQRAQGHDGDGNPVPGWGFKVLGPCGALWSTLADMTHYVRLNLGLIPTPLAPSLALTQQRRQASPVGHIGLGWHIDRTGFHRHSGGTGGFASFVGFDRAKALGVVVLGNSGTAFSGAVSKLGTALVGMLKGQPVTLTLPKSLPLPKTLLETYVGRYQLNPKTVFAVSIEGDHLVVKSGNNSARLYAKSPSRFYTRVVPFEFSFVKDNKDGSVQLFMHIGKRKLPLKKVK
jgi:D-alanyl-D-alanine-carboxypeptidase/D-alanyl-D-alanine-endopeptidase